MANFNDLTFKSGLAGDIGGFIRLKHGLGNIYYGPSIVLKSFDQFCYENFPNESILSKRIVMAWHQRGINRYLSPKTLRLQMTPICHLAKYQCDKGTTAYIFPIKTLPPEKRYTPHIYSNEELIRFFNSTDSCHFSHQYPYRHLIMPLFFRLLYSCGLRVSEATSLLTENVDIENGVIRIVGAKNSGERLVPLSEDMQNRCTVYYQQVHSNEQHQYFFPSRTQEPIKYMNIYGNFRRFLRNANISHGGKNHQIRIHDFRHTFAVHCLRNWVKEGKDLNTCYPYLKAYMGHSLFRYTTYYLRITAEIYPTIGQVLEDQYSDIIPFTVVDDHENF